jgi:hypothetical protein
MLEIDCRKCENLVSPSAGCRLYGAVPAIATAACIADRFKNYTPKQEPQTEITPGATVWVIARDEDNAALEVEGYVFLARVEDAVILTPKINDYDLAGIMAYHVEQTAEFEETSLVVFPAADCYAKKTDAVAAFTIETEC